MKKKMMKQFSSLFLSMMLIVAMALCTTGCNENTKKNPATQTENEPSSETNVLGEGKTVFMFTVVDKDGNETEFEIHTDKATVGEALVELKLIEGETSEFGLYVKKVNGITADYNVDGTYWAFYVDGEYSMSGVDSTTIEEGKTYSMKVSK